MMIDEQETDWFLFFLSLFFLKKGGKRREGRKVLNRYTYFSFIFLGEEVGWGTLDRGGSAAC